MAPTTRTAKKKNSPPSKRKNQESKHKGERIGDEIASFDDESDFSSDDSLSADPELEDLVLQTAARMTGHVHAEGMDDEETAKGSEPNTAADGEVGEDGRSETGLPFVLDVNPTSKSRIRIEVNRVNHLTDSGASSSKSSDLNALNLREQPSAVLSQPTIQTDREEEEFMSLEPTDDASSEQHHHSKRQGSKAAQNLQTAQRRGKGRLNTGKELATELDSGLDLSDTYLTFTGEQPQKTKTSAEMVLVKSSQDKLLKKSIITPDFEKQHSIPPYREATRLLKKRKKKERESSTGDGWYNMAATEMTDELRNDIKALRMRASLDPKRFYKHNDMTALPKFVQVGTVVESPADFYHSRIPKKQRKQTIVEELLADAETRRYNKRKYMYLELQEKSKRWGQRTNRNKKGKKKGRN